MLIWVIEWSQCFKIPVAQHWGGRGHITVRTKVRGVKISRIFQKNSRETVSVSAICDEYYSRGDSIVQTSCPWVSEDVLIIMNLSHQQLLFCVNPFSHKSDQYQFSPINFNIFLREKVQRIYKMITKKEMLLSFIIFLSPNGSLKNDMATIIVVVFPLWPISRYHF